MRTRKHKRNLFYILGVLFALVIVFYFSRFIPRRGGQAGGGALEPARHVMGVPVYEAFLAKGSVGRSGEKREVKMIVIHETANTSAQANAAAHSHYLLSGEGGTTSWHYTVDENEIYQHIPDGEIAYHAGDTSDPEGGNAGGIGVELCINHGTNFDAVMDNAARLVAQLLVEHELTMDSVVQHYDCSGKNCPAHMRGTGLYETFITLAETYYTQLLSENALETSGA